MNIREIFAVLGISETKNEDQIRAAYRGLLTGVNPEDDPEGFKRLRRAYEEALAHAKEPDDKEIQEAEWMEESGPAGGFLRKLSDVYHSLPRRLDAAEWKGLTEDPVLQSLDGAEAARKGLFTFLADHFRLPCRIWQQLDEAFFIGENEQEFREFLPGGFVDFILFKIKDKSGNSDFPMEKFQGGPDADYDGFLQDFLSFLNEDRDGSTEELKTIEKQLLQLESYGISHPWLDLENIRYRYRLEEKAEAERMVRVLLEENKDDEKIRLTGASLLLNCGHTEEASDLYEDYLKWEKQTEHGTYTAMFGLAGIAASNGDWEKARTLAMEAREQQNTQEVQDLLLRVNKELISRLSSKTETLTSEEADLLGWCYIHSEQSAEGMEFFEAHPEYYEDSEDCHKQRAVMSMTAGEPERALKEAALWRQCLEQKMESGKEAEEVQIQELEENRLNLELARSYQVEGRSLRDLYKQEKDVNGPDSEKAKEIYDRSLKAIDQAISLSPEDLNFMMQKAALLRDGQDHKAVVGLCEKILELDGSYFWACYYLQEAYEELRMAQEVVDTFYRAKEIYNGHPDIYMRAMKVFRAYRQYEDALGIITQAEEAGVDSLELMVEKVGLLEELMENEEDWRKADAFAAEVIERLEREDASSDLLAEAYLKRAYINDSGDKNNPNKDQQLDRVFAEKSLELKDSPRARYYLGRYYMEYEKDSAKAFPHFEKSEELGMKYDWLYFYMARCFENIKKWYRAIDYYKKVMEINPEFRDACWRIGWLYTNRFIRTLQKEYAEQALHYFDLQEEKFGPMLVNYRKRANIYERLREYEKALKEVDLGIEMEADSGLLFLRGEILRFMGRYDEAVESYEKSMAAEDRYDANDVSCCSGIFQCYLRQRRLDEGIAHMEEILKREIEEKVRLKCLDSIWKLQAQAGYYGKALKTMELRHGNADPGSRAGDDWDTESDRIDDIRQFWMEFEHHPVETLLEKCRAAASLAEMSLRDETATRKSQAGLYQSAGEWYYYLGENETAGIFLNQAWRLSKKDENYPYSQSLKSILMKNYYWLNDLEKAKQFRDLYRKDVVKDNEGCEDLEFTLEELVTRPTMESKQLLFNLFCCAYFTGEYDSARRYAALMESRDMCWWCTQDDCADIWTVRGYLAMLDGGKEEAVKAFKTGERFCWLGGSMEGRMCIRRLEKEVEKV